MDSALNTAFSEWGNILHNTIIATAIADRLVENSEVFLHSLAGAKKSGGAKLVVAKLVLCAAGV